MVYIAAASIAGWAATVAAFIRQSASQTRAHGRREDLLINQLLHAVGKTWQPAPATADPEPASDLDREPPALVDPSQLADF